MTASPPPLASGMPRMSSTLRWTEQRQPLFGSGTADSRRKQSFDRFLHQELHMAAERRRAVADQLLAALVGQHDAHRHRIEPCVQSFDLGLDGTSRHTLVVEITTQLLDLAASEPAHRSPAVSSLAAGGSSESVEMSTFGRGAFLWSGTQPVTTNRTRSAMLTAWSPMRS